MAFIIIMSQSVMKYGVTQWCEAISPVIFEFSNLKYLTAPDESIMSRIYHAIGANASYTAQSIRATEIEPLLVHIPEITPSGPTSGLLAALFPLKQPQSTPRPPGKRNFGIEYVPKSGRHNRD